MQRESHYKTFEQFTYGNSIPVSKLINKELDHNNTTLNMTWEEKYATSTKEPKVFGPPLWFVVHNSAAHYPLSPSPICQQHVIQFIRSIPYLVPCDDCFIHAQNYICKFNDNELKDITSTRSKYFNWTVQFHNFVNERLGKRSYTVEEAYNMYHNTSQVKVLKYSA